MMMTDTGKRSSADLEECVSAIEPELARAFPEESAEERRRLGRRWLRFECLGSGIVEEIATGRVKFWHLTFQEYLAARALAWLGDGDDPDKDWWPRLEKHIDDAQWRETVELLPGCLLDEGGSRRVDTLLERALGIEGESEDLSSRARAAGVVGRLLAPLEVYDYNPDVGILEEYQKSLDDALAIFKPEARPKCR